MLWYRMRSNLLVHGVPELQEPMLAVGLGRLTFTGRVTLGCAPASHRPRGSRTKAHIEARGSRTFVCIGDNTQIESDFTAVVERASILIGSSVRIGQGVHVLDVRPQPGQHPNDEAIDGAPVCRPVVVEDDVVIGSHVRIFGGVRICRGARIASHSLVTSDVPEYTVYGGRPARMVSEVRRHPQPRRRSTALHTHGL
jgi:acetyltransferase-like isoleucine patch superfamily enzyme